jgi:serine/threonine protein kinase
VYSLGATLYFLLCGRIPVDFPADADDADLARHVVYAPRVSIKLRVPALDARLAAVVDKACHRDSSERFPSAEAFRSALAAV